MSLVKKPVTGMKDILPAEMAIRDYLIGIIKDTYRGYGFSSIETPCVEHIENLLSKQGGDNEKLIFKILKRGEKLNIKGASTEAEVVDMGLRYDLTLPLARYYANHAAELSSPFKALQIGSVWRADRPQKGRFRQFTQCDIDILGEAGSLAEIELILATTTAISRMVTDKNFTVRINDREILKAMASYSGFGQEHIEQVFITLDKMDKIGLEGVKEELLALGYALESVERYIDLFKISRKTSSDVIALGEILSDFADKAIFENLAQIMDTVLACTDISLNLEFDATLVRGMGYYTGTIFEVEMEGFLGSIGGGGRYDKMIGRFTGNETPACGFSIGFERIITILLEDGFKVPSESEKKVYLFEKSISTEKLSDIIKDASADRKKGQTVLVAKMNKNKKFQRQQLEDAGYTEFIEVYKDTLK